MKKSGTSEAELSARMHYKGPGSSSGEGTPMGPTRSIGGSALPNLGAEELAMEPLRHTSKTFYLFLGALIGGVLWFGYAWFVQLSQGLVVTGMRDIPGGSAWGVYMVNFVFFIGITHAGIAIASGIRLLKVKEYVPIARIAELLTIFSLMVAGISIVLDLGRPDRVFNIVLEYTERVGESPVVWDITAIATYLIFAITYLYIEMREDLARLAGRVKFQRLYRLLLPMYEQGERQRIERIVWWASIFNFPIMVMVHTTVAWVFGLMPARPGWYSAIMGPYYVAGAVLSGIAAVIVAAAIFRRVFNWQEVIGPKIFKGLGRFLAWVTIIYLYFVLAEQLTVRYSGPPAEMQVSNAVVQFQYAWAFWLQVGALSIAFVIYFLPTVRPSAFRVWTTVFASALVVVTLWVTRFLIVVPSLTNPYLYPTGVYAPTWVEWSLVGGGFVIVAFLFTLFTKVFPILPITEALED
jgi:Ni/Fe-hydrogenase subunit HybB-like protein